MALPITAMETKGESGNSIRKNLPINLHKNQDSRIPYNFFKMKVPLFLSELFQDKRTRISDTI